MISSLKLLTRGARIRGAARVLILPYKMCVRVLSVKRATAPHTA